MSSTMTTSARKEHLKRTIADAFADVPYPGDEAIALDPTSDEGEKLQRALEGHHWRDVALDGVASRWIVYLHPEARRFYLPAFLLRAIDRLPQEGSYSLTDLVGLMPPPDITRFQREYDAYTPAQKKAIRLFLEYARDNAKERDVDALARLALERYWGRQGEDRPADVSIARAGLTRKERVRQAILQAFADVPYPGDEAIAAHPEGQDGPELIRDFKGYGWREVQRAMLCCNTDTLSYFSNAGLRFYLPAYLLAALDCDDIVFDATMYCLDPSSDDPRLEVWGKARLSVFRPAERQAIRLFLEYVRDELTGEYVRRCARQLLEQFWAKDN
jgi:hypothetical protein